MQAHICSLHNVYALCAPLDHPDTAIVFQKINPSQKCPVPYSFPFVIDSLSFFFIVLVLPKISKVFPLSDAAAAHRLIDTGHAKGKIMIQMKS